MDGENHGKSYLNLMIWRDFTHYFWFNTHMKLRLQKGPEFSMMISETHCEPGFGQAPVCIYANINIFMYILYMYTIYVNKINICILYVYIIYIIIIICIYIYTYIYIYLCKSVI